ncbi:hypothetical protein [Saccharopolyspora griseoalba]|uniref:Uncharacterized protein n=1 Tax=Saccharopolyspora griseoalba TaxID=1431848 RepID=A0ABW2LGX4_9PSEU
MTRRHGLMGPNTVRVIGLVLAVGMAAGVGGPYLVQAGVPIWAVMLLVLLALGVPIFAMSRDKNQD